MLDSTAYVHLMSCFSGLFRPHAGIGDRVQPDDTVGVFEVMKLFSTLKAGVAGTIAAVPASNEAMVQQDQVLIIIKPDD